MSARITESIAGGFSKLTDSRAAIARRYALEALHEAERSYRVVCSGRNLYGLVAIAQASLDVVGMVESYVPNDLVRLGPAEGMPPLPMLDLSLVSAPGEPSSITIQLRDALGRDLGRVNGLTRSKSKT